VLHLPSMAGTSCSSTHSEPVPVDCRQGELFKSDGEIIKGARPGPSVAASNSNGTAAYDLGTSPKPLPALDTTSTRQQASAKANSTAARAEAAAQEKLQQVLQDKQRCCAAAKASLDDAQQQHASCSSTIMHLQQQISAGQRKADMLQQRIKSMQAAADADRLWKQQKLDTAQVACEQLASQMEAVGQVLADAQARHQQVQQQYHVQRTAADGSAQVLQAEQSHSGNVKQRSAAKAAVSRLEQSVRKAQLQLAAQEKELARLKGLDRAAGEPACGQGTSSWFRQQWWLVWHCSGYHLFW
jgi:hypothetical protein